MRISRTHQASRPARQAVASKSIVKRSTPVLRRFEASSPQEVAAALMKRPKGSLTAREVLTIPEGPPFYELLEGNLVVMPSPTVRHRQIQLNLACLIQPYVRKVGGKLILPVDVVLDGKNVYEPDLVYVSPGREKIILERRLEGAPDLAVEILSPSTQRKDRLVKKRNHAKAGTKHLWFVESRDALVEEWTLDAATRTYREAAMLDSIKDIFKPAVFPRLKLPLSKIYEGVRFPESCSGD